MLSARFHPTGLAFLPILAGCLVFHSAPTQAEENSPWKAGVASVEITPDEPVFLAGYASRDRPHDGIAAPIRAKALALSDGDGHRAVILTTDLIGLSAEVAEPICDRIIDATGLGRADILINSSHTHAGPMLTLAPDPTTKMDASQSGRQVAYTRKVQDHLVEIAVTSLKECHQPAKLSLATGIAPFVMNRREYTTDRGIILGVNPRGPVDRSVPALRVTTGEGKLLAVLFQAACHNTTLGGDFYQITGDFAGYAQAVIEERHPGTTALFMIGCAGDANPHPRGKLEDSMRHGQVLGDEVCRLLDDKKAWTPIEGPLATRFAQVDLPLQPPPDAKGLAELKLQSGSWRGFVATEIERRQKEGAPIPTVYRAPFAVWQFGQDLTLVGMSGEVVVDYVGRLERELGPTRLWIAAYCNDVYGYLPSARVLREGGYETRGIYTGGIGFFAPETEDVAASAIRELAIEAGRPPVGSSAIPRQ